MKYKRTAAALLAVLMCVVPAGCSGGGSHVIITQHTSRTDGVSDSKPYKTDDSLTKEDITLTVWESKDGPDEWIKKAGESFNSLYPNIHIEYVNVELTETTKELLDTKSTVKRPDVFAAPCDMMGELAENGLIPSEIRRQTDKEPVLYKQGGLRCMPCSGIHNQALPHRPRR